MKYFFSLAIIFLCLTAPGYAEDAEYIHQLVFDSIQEIQSTVDHIVSIPADQRSFNNTIKPWNQLCVRLLNDFNQLETFKKSESIRSLADEAFQELYAIQSRMTMPDSPLRRILNDVALQALNDVSLNPIQQYIVRHLWEDCEDEQIELLGSLQEKENISQDFTMLYFAVGQNPIFDIVDHSLLTSTDVIYIQTLCSEEALYALYEALKEDFAYFSVTVYSTTTSWGLPNSKSYSVLRASKYPLDTVWIDQISTVCNASNIFDFILKSQEMGIGHMHKMHLKNVEEKEEICEMELFSIIEKVQQGNTLIDAYFASSNDHNSQYGLWLQLFPQCFPTPSNLPCLIDTAVINIPNPIPEAPLPIIGLCFAQVCDLKQNITCLLRSSQGRGERWHRGEREESIEINFKADSDGNVSLTAEGSVSYKNERGEAHANAWGRVERSSGGEYSTDGGIGGGVRQNN